MNERRNCLPGAFHTSFRWVLLWEVSHGLQRWLLHPVQQKHFLRASSIEPRHFPLAKEANTVSGRSHALAPGPARSDATQTGTRGSP